MAVFPPLKKGLFLSTYSVYGMTTGGKSGPYDETHFQHEHESAQYEDTPTTCFRGYNWRTDVLQETREVYDVTTKGQSRPFSNTVIWNKQHNGHHQNIK